MPVTESDLSTFITKFKKDVASTVANPVALDFSRLTYSSKSYSSAVFQNLGNRLGDIYLPNNITSINSYSRFVGNYKIKLHIHSAITSIDLVQMNSGALEDGCGFFVDSGNSKYSSIDGVLYSKDGKTLNQLPTFKNGSSFIVPEGVEQFYEYSMSNNNVLSEVTMPSSVKSINGATFMYDKYLVCIRFLKTVTSVSEVPSMQANLSSIGLSAGKQRTIIVPDGTIGYYSAALPAANISGWTIIEESAVEGSGDSTIGGLDDNKDYDHGLW